MVLSSFHIVVCAAQPSCSSSFSVVSATSGQTWGSRLTSYCCALPACCLPPISLSRFSIFLLPSFLCYRTQFLTGFPFSHFQAANDNGEGDWRERQGLFENRKKKRTRVRGSQEGEVRKDKIHDML